MTLSSGSFWPRLRRCLVIGLVSAFLPVSICSTRTLAQGPASQKYALVYNGPASAEDCPEAAAAIAKRAGLPVVFIADIGKLPGLLSGAAVFIIGGTGDDLSPLTRAFTPTVSAALKEYIGKGGRFLGLCGGGFMASTGWDEGKLRMNGLGLIPAACNVYKDDFEARIIPIRWKGAVRQMYFKAGPYFIPAKDASGVEVVATYEDGSPAALVSALGKGKVAVSGPHPEARETWPEEAKNGSRWVSSADLAVQMLADLLSDQPVQARK